MSTNNDQEPFVQKEVPIANPYTSDSYDSDTDVSDLDLSATDSTDSSDSETSVCQCLDEEMPLSKILHHVQRNYILVIPYERSHWTSYPIHSNRVIADARDWYSAHVAYFNMLHDEHAEVEGECKDGCMQFLDELRVELEKAVPIIERLEGTQDGPVDGLASLITFQEMRGRVWDIIRKRGTGIVEEEGSRVENRGVKRRLSSPF